MALFGIPFLVTGTQLNALKSSIFEKLLFKQSAWLKSEHGFHSLFCLGTLRKVEARGLFEGIANPSWIMVLNSFFTMLRVYRLGSKVTGGPGGMTI